MYMALTSDGQTGINDHLV